MDGGGKTVDTSSSSASQGTWRPPQQLMPGYGFLAGNSMDLAGKPVPFFPGQTYVGPSAPTQAGVNAGMAGAQAMMPALQTMQGNYNFLSGAADVANNPYVQAQNKSMQQQVNQNLSRNLLPQLQSNAMSVNALGSDRLGLAQGQAIGDTSQALANQVSQNNLTAYGQGLGAQQNALGQTGNVLANMMAPSQAMSSVGQQVEGYQGRALQDSMSRFAHQYQEPFSRMQNLAQTLGFLQPFGTTYGNSVGQGTQPNPNYQSPLQTGLGVAGVGLGSMGK